MVNALERQARTLREIEVLITSGQVQTLDFHNHAMAMAELVSRCDEVA